MTNTETRNWAPGWMLSGIVCVRCRVAFAGRRVRGAYTKQGITCATCLDRPVVLALLVRSRAERHVVSDLAYDAGWTLRPAPGGYELELPPAMLRDAVGLLDAVGVVWQELDD